MQTNPYHDFLARLRGDPADKKRGAPGASKYLRRDSKHRRGGPAGLTPKDARALKRRADEKQKRARRIAEASRRANRRKR